MSSASTRLVAHPLDEHLLSFTPTDDGLFTAGCGCGRQFGSGTPEQMVDAWDSHVGCVAAAAGVSSPRIADLAEDLLAAFPPSMHPAVLVEALEGLRGELVGARS